MNKNNSFHDETESPQDSLSDDLKKSFESFENHADADVMKKSAQQMAEKVTEFIQQYPLPTVLGATAVGFLLGFFTGRRK